MAIWGKNTVGRGTDARAMRYDILKDSPLDAIWRANGGGGRDEENGEEDRRKKLTSCISWKPSLFSLI